jgi:hypothetical protein
MQPVNEHLTLQTLNDDTGAAILRFRSSETSPAPGVAAPLINDRGPLIVPTGEILERNERIYPRTKDRTRWTRPTDRPSR